MDLVKLLAQCPLLLTLYRLIDVTLYGEVNYLDSASVNRGTERKRRRIIFVQTIISTVEDGRLGRDNSSAILVAQFSGRLTCRRQGQWPRIRSSGYTRWCDSGSITCDSRRIWSRWTEIVVNVDRQ